MIFSDEAGVECLFKLYQFYECHSESVIIPRLLQVSSEILTRFFPLVDQSAYRREPCECSLACSSSPCTNSSMHQFRHHSKEFNDYLNVYLKSILFSSFDVLVSFVKAIAFFLKNRFENDETKNSAIARFLRIESHFSLR